MTLSQKDFEELRALEESLWRTETRSNLVHQEKIFALDFFEFGRSGKRYTRDQVIISDPKNINAILPLQNFKISALGENYVLITYISEVQNEKIEEPIVLRFGLARQMVGSCIFIKGRPQAIFESHV